MKKQNKGITLIALVVTIIILLMLSGVAVNLVLGQNGILKRARQAKIETERSEILDMLVFAVSNINLKRVEEKRPLLSYYETLEVFIQKGEFDVTQYPITGYKLSEGKDEVTLSAKKQKGTGIEYRYKIEIKTGKVISLGNGTVEDGTGTGGTGGEGTGISKINYVLNGGSFQQASINQYKEGEIIELSIPQKTGAIFDGWYQNASFTGDSIYRTTEGMTGDITLYAKWIEEANADYFTYKTADGKDQITGLSTEGRTAYNNGELNNLVIPKKHGENDIIAIGNSYAFANCNTISKVVIQENIETIAGSAFYNCTGIEEIVAPISLNLGDNQFINCTQIKKITFTKGTGVGPSYSNSSLYKKTPWYNTQETMTLKFEEGITTIGDMMFNGSMTLQTVEFASTIEKIGDYAFGGCNGIQTIELPTSLTSIGNYAFANCTGISGNIEMPNSIETIGEYAFSRCTGIEGELVFDSIKTIGVCAFSSCANITKVSFSQTAETIGSSSFSDCVGINEIVAPISLDLGDNQFSNCTGIKKVTILTGNGTVPYYGGITGSHTYNKYQRTPWYYSRASIEDVIIEEGVTEIPNFMFRTCTGISNIYLPSTLTKIGTYAFENCTTAVFNYNGTQSDWDDKVTIETGNDNVTQNLNFKK